MSTQNSHGNFKYKIMVIMKTAGTAVAQESKHMEVISYEDRGDASIALNALKDRASISNLTVISLF